MSTREKLIGLLNSGELHRVAATVTTRGRLAESIGITDHAYSSATERMRAAGIAFPTFPELRAARPPQPVNDDAPTSPRIQLPPVPHHRPAAPRTFEDDIAERKERSAVAELKSRLADALAELERCRLELSTAGAAEAARMVVEPIERREVASGLREATAVALASDWHIEERVDPAAVNDLNEYNIDVSRKRVGRFFSGFEYLIRYHQDHFAIRDGVLWLGGDLITGHLREENLESNTLSPVQAIATLHVWIADGIRGLLEGSGLESLHVVCSSGNHGRLTHKIRPSTREANSIEWLLYVGLAREFANDPRVKFTLPAGAHTYIRIYDFVIRFLHGDECKFGGGIGGITVPLYKALARFETMHHAYLTCFAHFHQLHDLADFVVNGSLIGVTPFSLTIGARHEIPQQAFFLIDSKRGKTFFSDIRVTDSERRR